MKIKQILAAVAAGAIAVSAMVTGIAAEAVTLEKTIYTYSGEIGTAKFEATMTLGSDEPAVANDSFIEIFFPRAVTAEYPGIIGFKNATLYIQANSLEINGVKPFADDKNEILIKNEFKVRAYPSIFESNNPAGDGRTFGNYTNEVAKLINISSVGAKTITVKGTLLGDPATVEEEQINENALTYADKLKFTPISDAFFMTLNNYKTKVYNTATTQYNFLTPFATFDGTADDRKAFFTMNNKSVFDAGDTTRNTFVESQAYTIEEQAAIKTEGADLKLEIELANRAVGSVMSYVQVEIFNSVTSKYGTPKAAVLEGTTATLYLSQGDIYQPAYDIFNTSFKITAGADETKTYNNYVKEVKLVISYDDGVVSSELDSDDVLDSEDEPEPEIEGEDDFIDEEPVDEDVVEDDFIEDDVDDVDFGEDDAIFEEDVPAADDAAAEAPAADDAAAADANPGTGVALAIVPAIIAGAGAVVARKRK